MSTEAGHHAGRPYTDANGCMHLNGSPLYDGSENDVSHVISSTADGLKIVRGVSAVTGSLTVATGLGTVQTVIATLQDDAANRKKLTQD